MLLNYIKIALRNLQKNKLFSVINVSSMAISLASSFLITLFVWDELKFDRHHPDGDRTFRVYNIRQGDDGIVSHLPIVPYPFATYMQKDFPEIESAVRIMDTYGELLFDVDGKKILQADGMFAEPDVFDMLTVDVISGTAKAALEKSNSVALSQSVAKKLFGEIDPLGKTIKINERDYLVTALYADPPIHFHLKAGYLLSMSTLPFLREREENWQWQQIFTYLKLKPGTDPKILESKFPAFVEKYAYPKIKSVGFTYVPRLQNIKDIHLHSSNFEWEIAQRGNAQTVYILSVTAIVLLVIACLNFINLSTARAIKRMKEVGVRKVIGAARNQLVLQFISESIVITIVGLVFAIVAAQLALPYLNVLAEKELSLPLSIEIVTIVFLFCVILGTIAGSYPAFYLSRFRPAAVLYNKQMRTGGTAIFRQGLVVLQFVFSSFLIIGSMIVFSQHDLLLNKNMGFNKEQLVMIPLRDAQLRNYETTKREFANHPGVVSTTVGFGIPGDLIAGDEIIDPEKNKTVPVNLFCIDHDYIQTMGMTMVSGREFSKEIPTDTSEAFIINETALSVMGYKSPEDAIGKPLRWNIWGRNSLKRGRVIGVIKDFNIKSLRDKLSPVVLHIYPQAFWKLTVRVKPDQVPQAMAHLKSTYERLDPAWPFTYSFVDEKFSAMYTTEQKLTNLFSIFTGLAIGVACLGLFGLVEYSVNQRNKEVSIRKVFGASIGSLLMLLTRSYFILVLIAFMIIIPLSYFAAKEWLSNFAYHITISPWMYLKAYGLIMAITVLTVSFQSIRAALSNPAQVLKGE
ncbi:MAG TPA: ABC transporter permease [Chryseolinea sp.]|nr:ABC transporter permease [Chryseolinea sp.]